MKSCLETILATLSILFLSAAIGATQTIDASDLAFSISNDQQNSLNLNSREPLIVRNRLDSGCTLTTYADFVSLSRSGGQNFSLLTRAGDNSALLKSQDFEYVMGMGPRVGVVGEDVLCGCDVEASYFGIDSWSASSYVTAPSGGMNYMMLGQSTYLSPGTTAGYEYVSRLLNAEMNLRYPILENIYVLGGLRYVQLHEGLDSSINNGSSITSLGVNLDNYLYGGQIGLNVAFINVERFSIEGVVKAGVFQNYADMTANFNGSSTGRGNTEHIAFLGEIGLMGVVRITDCLSIRGGYQAMWLDGVGIACDQFNSGDSTNYKPYFGGTLLYHGAFAGLELAF